MGDLPTNGATNGSANGQIPHTPIKYFTSKHGHKRLVKPRQYQIALLMAQDVGTFAIAKQLNSNQSYISQIRNQPHMIALAQEIKQELYHQELATKDEAQKSIKALHLTIDRMLQVLESDEKVPNSFLLRCYEQLADRVGLPKKSVSSNTKTVISADIGNIADRLAAARKRADARKPETIEGKLANETPVTSPEPSVEPPASEEAASDAD